MYVATQKDNFVCKIAYCHKNHYDYDYDNDIIKSVGIYAVACIIVVKSSRGGALPVLNLAKKKNK